MNKAVPQLRQTAIQIITERASNRFIMGEVKIVRAPQTMNVVLFRIAISFSVMERSDYILRRAGAKAPISPLMKKVAAATDMKMKRRRTRGTSERSRASVRLTEEIVSIINASWSWLPGSTFADLFFIIRRLWSTRCWPTPSLATAFASYSGIY